MRLESHWQRATPLAMALLPLAGFYRAAVALRRGLYRLGLRRTHRMPVPVVIVGNLTVGGTGKTPLVLWLVHRLREHGWSPGIVTRGYKSGAGKSTLAVAADADPTLVGDEAAVLARNGGCPVVIGRRRAQAARRLVDEYGCDVVVADDGLQHYALARDVEIAVIDGARRFGNGHCLPAGPLREPLARLREVHLRVTQGDPAPGELGMRLRPVALRRVGAPQMQHAPQSFAGRRVHAVAGIGYPQRFFAQLRALAMEVIPHPFPDHHSLTAADIQFGDALPVIMTEKDAVKCERFADARCWYLAVEAEPDSALLDEILRLLRRRISVSRKS